LYAVAPDVVSDIESPDMIVISRIVVTVIPAGAEITTLDVDAQPLEGSVTVNV
jgi:hypothetical protein